MARSLHKMSLMSFLWCGLVSAAFLMPSECVGVPFEDGLAARRNEFDAEMFQKQVLAAVEKIMPSVVAVRDRGGTFSAVVVSEDGLVLSAGHAVTPNRSYTLIFADGKTVPARGLGVDERVDCAMLKITKPGSWPAAEIGESHKLVRNQPCLSVSHPGRHDVKRGPLVRLGYIADPLNAQGMIQSTAKMEPGDSGGPLVDLQGRVIGIHSSIRRTLDRNYEVPIDVFRKYWDELQEPKRFRGSWPSLPKLGLQVQQNDDEDAVEVTSVTKQSHADEAGLKVGDEIVRVSSQRIRDNDDLGGAFRKLASREVDSISLEIKRGGESSKLELKIPRNDEQAMPELRRLQAQYATLESKLDDVVVRIESSASDETIEVWGTRLKSTGQVISKSSRVFDQPVIRWNGNQYSAKVIKRDPANDLVLLQADLPQPDKGVDLSYLPGDMGEQRGRLLLSPDDKSDGQVSVWGSRYFKVARTRASGGYLGVQLGQVQGKVVLQVVDRNRAAAKAGLNAGDVVLEIDDKQIARINDLIRYVQKTAPYQTVRVKILREGNEILKPVVLGSRPESGAHAADQLPGGKSKRRDGFSWVISHDADVRPEQCGGPVFSARGDFLGINIARNSRTRCYVIPKSVLEKFVGN